MDLKPATDRARGAWDVGYSAYRYQGRRVDNAQKWCSSEVQSVKSGLPTELGSAMGKFFAISYVSLPRTVLRLSNITCSVRFLFKFGCCLVAVSALLKKSNNLPGLLWDSSVQPLVADCTPSLTWWHNWCCWKWRWRVIHSITASVVFLKRALCVC